MSAKSQVSLTNVTLSSESHSVIMGELRVSTPIPGTIDIPQQAQSVESHVILQKYQDHEFKSQLELSPVRPFTIKLYDQCGNLCNKWEASRTDNAHGNVAISAENKALFSNIAFPTISTGGQMYLAITEYGGLENCYLKESKRVLVQKDFEAFTKRVVASSIILFIRDSIANELLDLGFDLTRIFQAVFKAPQERSLAAFLCEYLAGKSVSDSTPSFQGMLHFGKTIEIIATKFSPVKFVEPIQCTLRSNGRIQINSLHTDCATRFFAIVGHANRHQLHCSEETTQSSFPLAAYTASSVPNMSPGHFEEIVKAQLFLIKLKTLVGVVDAPVIAKFMKDHAAKVISYMFDSPLAVFDSIETESEMTKMILEYATSLRWQVYDLLINFAENVDTKKGNRNGGKFGRFGRNAYEDEQDAFHIPHSMAMPMPPPVFSGPPPTNAHAKTVKFGNFQTFGSSDAAV